MKSNKQEIGIVVAIDRNYAIGKNGELLCHLPNDLKRFKEITTRHTVIMGRKTWNSLPLKFRPLPNRRNIVVSRNENLELEGAEIAHSIEEALQLADQDEKVFFIGGASIYESALKYADTVYITEIRHTFPEADMFFPKVPWQIEWELRTFETVPADEKNLYDTIFRVY
ncbi:MAG: dihydrofolate reductase [Candidatus Peribacteria bacterium]|jgi:dihydrofolate reductase|nr:dihydrofolate reductase [Candidatus Peribacteria bacterium]